MNQIQAPPAIPVEEQKAELPEAKPIPAPPAQIPTPTVGPVEDGKPKLPVTQVSALPKPTTAKQSEIEKDDENKTGALSLLALFVTNFFGSFVDFLRSDEEVPHIGLIAITAVSDDDDDQPEKTAEPRGTVEQIKPVAITASQSLTPPAKTIEVKPAEVHVVEVNPIGGQSVEVKTIEIPVVPAAPMIPISSEAPAQHI